MDFNYQFPPVILSGHTFAIRNILPEDSVEELTELLHRAYKRLADMNLHFVATYQPLETTLERISSGYCFVATENEQIFGTLTLYPPQKQGHCEFYTREDVWHFGQFAVGPALQSLGLGGILLSVAEEFAAKKGAKHLALDTAESAEHLIRYYEKRSYEFQQHVQWDVTNYRSIVLAKKIA